MARIMAHHNNTSQSLSFDILSEESPPSNLRHSTATTTSSLKGDEVLRELSDGQIQSRITSTRSPVSPLGCASPSAKSPSKVSTIPDSGQAKPQTFRRSIRLQRPQADCETFEPLVAVPEESSSIVETSDLDATTPVTAAAVLPTVVPDGAAAVCHGTGSSETADSTPSLQDQVAKHLAGQFEWIMTYAAEAKSQAFGSSCKDDHSSAVSHDYRLYGCNLLPVGRRGVAQHSAEPSTDIYTLLATPLTQDSFPSPPMSDSRGAGIPTLVSLAQVPPPPYPGTPLKVPEVVDMVEQAISPYLAVLSEHSSCAVDGSSRPGSFSLPRIEDSLEELDRLEEELEAVHQVTRSRQFSTSKDQLGLASAVTPLKTNSTTPSSSKPMSIKGHAATVRVKSSLKERPLLRRSASLTFREKRSDQQSSSSESQAAEVDVSRSASTKTDFSSPRHPIKSNKPPTVPKFELPGEAVARRLKKQREARQAQQAQQAEAKKTQAAASKPRVGKLLSKPTFELPGEAISRRKREELEAKIRAEEEEARKRREFKARPVRHGLGPASLPRETLTSRVRQNRPSPETTDCKPNAQQKRMSTGTARSSVVDPSTADNASQSRGRVSTVLCTDGSRATSTSIGRASGKRLSVSSEELAVQRQRGKDVLAKDSSYTRDKERDRLERELAAKTAREEAAERSRIASREWAEKKRRRELLTKQAKENEAA